MNSSARRGAPSTGSCLAKTLSAVLLTFFALTVQGQTHERARFGLPRSVAVDSAGNIYVANANDHTVSRMTPSGEVTTFAGLEGVSGYVDGMRRAARFDNPSSVATDGAGNVYVADTGNHTIRKITPEGVVSTLAGVAGVPGSADGLQNAARFRNPYGVAADWSGNVYVADTYNQTIRRITPAGSVTTLAGQAGATGSADGSGSAARFRDPWSVAVDAAGNVYVADRFNGTIRRVTPAGVVTTIAGHARRKGSVDGPSGAALFSSPTGLAVDSEENVFVADTSDNTIRKIAPDGWVATIAGHSGEVGSADGIASAARFNYPSGVTVLNGAILVADTGNNAVRKITAAGAVTTLAHDAAGSGSRNLTPAEGGGSAGETPGPASKMGRLLIPEPNATSSPPGDANGDGTVTVSDVFYMINAFFVNGPGPVGPGDANGDGQTNVADIFYLINYLFAGGPPPV